MKNKAAEAGRDGHNWLSNGRSLREELGDWLSPRDTSEEDQAIEDLKAVLQAIIKIRQERNEFMRNNPQHTMRAEVEFDVERRIALLSREGDCILAFLEALNGKPR